MCFVPLLTRFTKHLGVIATGSATFYPPFMLARTMSTLDHMSGGRVGWNVVTSSEDRAAQNFGLEKLPEHDLRYEMAEEFIELALKLWESWEPDAITMNRETGYYADHTKVHPINYEGRFHSSRGPLNTPRSPQGRPVICQAGGSPRGRQFSSRSCSSSSPRSARPTARPGSARRSRTRCCRSTSSSNSYTWPR
jgi:alkanesulfonate monooxygenase SsuD/methylene tetrahydromethanopterin reductase-like flavin-dependent oxidoreductase (luciferase family)